jgi:hypothetical protein
MMNVSEHLLNIDLTLLRYVKFHLGFDLMLVNILQMNATRKGNLFFAFRNIDFTLT